MGGRIRYTEEFKLGAVAQVTDKKVLQALESFQNNLIGVEQQIRADNANRPLDYPYLIPSEIPQSINI